MVISVICCANWKQSAGHAQVVRHTVADAWCLEKRDLLGMRAVYHANYSMPGPAHNFSNLVAHQSGTYAYHSICIEYMCMAAHET